MSGNFCLLPKDRLEKALTPLRDPFAIAIMASLAVHGLLWVVLPLLPAARTEEFDARETVGVVELSPTEQLRLPDFANPQVTFPPLNSQTKLTQPPAKNSKTARKSPDPLFDNSSLYNFPLLNFPPPPVLNIPFSSLDTIPTIPNDRRRTKRQAPAKPKPTPKPTAPPDGLASATGTATGAADEKPKAPVRPEKLTPEQLARLLEDGRQNQDDRDLFTLNQANTTDADTRKNGSQFIVVAQQLSQGNLENNKDSWNKQENVTDLYPREACPYKLKGNAVVAALIQPDGKLAAKPTVLRSSGYKALNNAAIEYVAKQKFDPGEQYRVISFPFIFEPTEKLCPPGEPAKPGSEPAKPGNESEKPAS